jgi:hypothetical protein
MSIKTVTSQKKANGKKTNVTNAWIDRRTFDVVCRPAQHR